MSGMFITGDLICSDLGTKWVFRWVGVITIVVNSLAGLKEYGASTTSFLGVSQAR